MSSGKRDEITVRGAVQRTGVIALGGGALWVTQQWELGWMAGLLLLGLAFGILDVISGNEG